MIEPKKLGEVGIVVRDIEDPDGHAIELYVWK